MLDGWADGWVDVYVTHLSDVEGSEADCEDDQHSSQQLDGSSPPLPLET